MGGKTESGAGGSVFVIAEAGVNHNGDPVRAEELVDIAARAGADAVKFQTFRAAHLVQEDAPKAPYQKETTGSAESQYEMLRKLELSEAAHESLAQRCRERGLEFLSTPFDPASADLLERLGVARYKIASGEITNLPLLLHVGSKGKPVILSTGMSSLEEIGAALGSLRSAGAPGVTLLHCVSDYPTRPEDVNLRVMETLRSRFGVPVGFSDHTSGIAVPIAAAALGATVIEKHFTTDRKLPGPDHRASLEPGELAAMVRGIRDAEKALGDGHRRLTPGEISTRPIARRSLVAAEDLPPGTVVEARHLTARRPGTGISPMEIDRLVGRRLKTAVRKDSMITWAHLE
jgi:N-acetylneuraminate synthase/N,N'-diacetyllegionaminate synthase